VVAALNSRDPKIECRKLLVEWALYDADYTVMMIPPFPQHDWTTLRGLPGISGELWEHRVELARTYEPLRDIIHADEVNKTTAADTILVLACRASYVMNIANTARIVALDDYHHDANLDWFHPMRYSFCVSAENELRKLIGLPTSNDEDLAALFHRGSMMADVLGGCRFPDATFRERYQDRIKEGSMSLPRFNPSERRWE
jgi:hypothetical protein